MYNLWGKSYEGIIFLLLWSCIFHTIFERQLKQKTLENGNSYKCYNSLNIMQTATSEKLPRHVAETGRPFGVTQ